MVPGRARAQESPADSRERLVPARHTPAHGNRSWSWTAAEAGSPQSEEGDASGEDPGSPSRPCLHVLSRRRLEQRSASSRASSQQRPVVGGWGSGAMSSPQLGRHPLHTGELPAPLSGSLPAPIPPFFNKEPPTPSTLSVTHVTDKG